MAFSLRELGLQKFLYGWFVARTKVGRPNLVAYLNRTPTFEWCVVRCGPKNEPKRYVFKRDWTTCSSLDSIVNIIGGAL